MKKKYLICIVTLCIFINLNMSAQRLYFSSPKESVKLISQLLIKEKWDELTKYYFLENTSQETIDSMNNGSYFIRDERPEVAHPSGSWKYKKPFPPMFNYMNHTQFENNKILVNLNLKIDQGEGMIQEGLTSFFLIRSDKGYQIFP